MGKWTKQNFLKRRNSNGQKTHEKILIISNYTRNANQNYTKISPYPIRIALIQNTTNRCWKGCVEKETPVHCWWVCKLVQPLWKKNLESSWKSKHWSAIWSSNPTPGDISKVMWHRLLQRHLHTHVYGSTIHNSQVMETAKMPHYWQMD
jgi:hypothetical protein